MMQIFKIRTSADLLWFSGQCHHLESQGTRVRIPAWAWKFVLVKECANQECNQLFPE